MEALLLQEFVIKQKVDAAQAKTALHDAELRKGLNKANVNEVGSKNGIKMTVVESSLIHFNQKILVSLGQGIFGDFAREGLVLNPKSTIILDKFEKLKIAVQKSKPAEMLEELTRFLHALFVNSNVEKRNK